METQGYPPAFGHLLLLDLAWETLLERVLLLPESYRRLSGNGPVPGSLSSWQPRSRFVYVADASHRAMETLDMAVFAGKTLGNHKQTGRSLAPTSWSAGCSGGAS